MVCLIPPPIFSFFLSVGFYTYSEFLENLPGQVAVWAASREAEYLHGRFIWANWDVDEVKAVLGKQISEEPNFLKVGFEGLSEKLPNPMIPPEVLQKLKELQAKN